jgi:mono/diheme cytochrome c family protein
MRAERSGRTQGERVRRVAVLLLMLSTSACTPLDNGLAWLFGRSMRDQVSFDPYENTRPPAVGSVPFASGNLQPGPFTTGMGQPLPLEYDVPSFTQAELTTVAAALTNPVPASEQSLNRGRIMFELYCAVCHGARGQSAEAPIFPKHPIMAAFNLSMGAATTYSDGYIYGMIRVGRGLMPAYGHQVPHFDRWHIVNYVRQLQTGGGAPAGGPAAPGAPAPGAPGGGRGGN